MFPGLIHHHHRPDAADEAPRGGGLHGHGGGGPSLVLTADPKPRLRWTADLHERFVDAVAQLGGPESGFMWDLSASTSIMCLLCRKIVWIMRLFLALS